MSETRETRVADAVEECIVCCEEKLVSIWIDDSPLCEPCVQEGIVAKFIDCLTKEAAYPVRWGSVALRVEDFLHYIDDPDGFMKVWADKMDEYETPVMERIYCRCGRFVTQKDKAFFRFACVDCKILFCARCGAMEPHPGHECETAKPTNPLEGLTRGKDYQLCPNEKCRIAVELADGCNHVICEAGCRTEFCMICGEKATADSGHWDIGRPCPRYNHPDQANAQHDIPGLHGFLQRLLDDREAIEALAARLMIEAPEVADERLAGTAIDLLWHFLGAEEYDRRIDDVVLRMNELPAPPDLSNTTPRQELVIRANHDRAMENSRLGVLMREQQQQLDTLITNARVQVSEAAIFGHPVPEFQRTAIALMTALRQNLDLYIHPERLRGVELVQHEVRHDQLEGAYGRHQAMIFRHYRGFYEILVQYAVVGEVRLLAANEEVDGVARADDVFRRETERLSRGIGPAADGFGREDVSQDELW